MRSSSTRSESAEDTPPEEPLPYGMHRPRTSSFPSGHATSAFTAAMLLADLVRAEGLADFPENHADKLAEWLTERQPKVVTSAHWDVIDQFERHVLVGNFAADLL